MCGIAGAISPGNLMLANGVQKMADALRHRGPDDNGIWADDSLGIAFAHRRLSIMDLSNAGHQPMISPSGRFVVVFNGEIYNHKQLRQTLVGEFWRGTSDTETLLVAIEKWGLESTLAKIVGMFAFALWDRSTKRLYLVRDRFGEKPLYYGWSNGQFIFASELKAMSAFPGWRGVVDRGALQDFVRLGYVPVPRSIYKGIAKLIPGSFVTVELDGQGEKTSEPTVYWRTRKVEEVGYEARLTFGLNEHEATDHLEFLLRRSVRSQMMADVPLGVFLSGGIDSSLITALMQVQSQEKVKSFSIGFLESGFDETAHARRIAQHLGTSHTDCYLSSKDAMGLVQQLPYIYDEPFGDSSQMPTLLLAELARKHVSVCLTGDGGDEVFGGYNRYIAGPIVWNHLNRWPLSFRQFAGGLLRVLGPNHWNFIGRILPNSLAYPQMGEKIHKLSQVLDVTDRHQFIQRLVAQGADELSVVIDGSAVESWADHEVKTFLKTGLVEEMMLRDKVGYLTDDILTKVDRATMALSLETRTPFLDRDVVEFAASLPLHHKIRDGKGKWLLRQVLHRHVPIDLVDRRKQGFAVPIGAWLRGPLRAWADTLLDHDRLQAEGYLMPRPVRQRWDEHLSGRRNWEHWLWNVLMFQSWQERWA